jgi:hypothetical protein
VRNRVGVMVRLAQAQRQHNHNLHNHDNHDNHVDLSRQRRRHYERAISAARVGASLSLDISSQPQPPRVGMRMRNHFSQSKDSNWQMHVSRI